MDNLTEPTQDKPCSERVENEAIVKSATLGQGSGERELDSGEALRNEKKRRKWFHFNDSIYRDAFTIDPSQIEEAMDILSADVLAYEIAMLPKIMHDAMIDTLRERNTLERIR